MEEHSHEIESSAALLVIKGSKILFVMVVVLLAVNLVDIVTLILELTKYLPEPQVAIPEFPTQAETAYDVFFNSVRGQGITISLLNNVLDILLKHQSLGTQSGSGYLSSNMYLLAIIIEHELYVVV
jgi:hypothetical protein